LQKVLDESEKEDNKSEESFDVALKMLRLDVISLFHFIMTKGDAFDLKKFSAQNVEEEEGDNFFVMDFYDFILNQNNRNLNNI
jgi:hypothetical protein